MIAPGTARKPASRKRFDDQPANLEGTLSHHFAPPGPPGTSSMSLSRNDNSTAPDALGRRRDAVAGLPCGIDRGGESGIGHQLGPYGLNAAGHHERPAR